MLYRSTHPWPDWVRSRRSYLLKVLVRYNGTLSNFHDGLVYFVLLLPLALKLLCHSPSRVLVMNHNWSATKQRLHLQSVAEISRRSVLWGDRIRQCGTSSGSRHKDNDLCHWQNYTELDGEAWSMACVPLRATRHKSKSKLRVGGVVYTGGKGSFKQGSIQH